MLAARRWCHAALLSLAPTSISSAAAAMVQTIDSYDQFKELVRDPLCIIPARED